MNMGWGLPHSQRWRVVARGGYPEPGYASGFLRCDRNFLGYFIKIFNIFFGNKK
jgi:hypothetical protein